MKLKIGNQEVTARKWKAKEKKEFLNIVRTSDNMDGLQDVLVYNCLEEKVIFNPDEFKYAMSSIRSRSLGDEIELEFYCDNCKSKFLDTVKLSEIVKPVYSGENAIKTKNYKIKIGNIRNIEYYKEIIRENPLESREYDFYLRIESINSDDSLTLEEIIDLFDEMDIDEYDKIFEEWERIRFKVDDTVEIVCKKCSDSVKYSFDEIPGFFPPSWFK